MSSHIDDLRARLLELDELTKLLRVESNQIVGYVPNDDGTPQQVVTDQKRFQAIGEELKQIAAEKASIENKIVRLRELYSQENLSGDPDYGNRLRADFAIQSFELAKRHFPIQLPEELIQDPQYLKLRDKFMPEIERLDALGPKIIERSRREVEIINGP